MNHSSAHVRYRDEIHEVPSGTTVGEFLGHHNGEVESTVLSALEAVQEEILYSVPQTPGSTKPAPPRRPGTRPAPTISGGPKENIISFEPLFDRLPDSEGDEGEGEGEEEPADERAEAEEADGEDGKGE